jgi:hypothetical protein
VAAATPFFLFQVDAGLSFSGGRWPFFFRWTLAERVRPRGLISLRKFARLLRPRLERPAAAGGVLSAGCRPSTTARATAGACRAFARLPSDPGLGDDRAPLDTSGRRSAATALSFRSG